MILLDVVNLIFSQLVGFFLWLLVTPFRLLVTLFDPIFSGLTDFMDFSGFMSVMETLRPFFTDVNWFIPFGAAVAIVRATIDIALILALIRGMEITTFREFSVVVQNMLSNMISEVADGVKKFLRQALEFFMG